MHCHEFISRTIKNSIAVAILNLIFSFSVLIGQLIILDDLKMGTSPLNFVLCKCESIHVFKGERIGAAWSPYKLWFMRDVSRTELYKRVL